jgi:hypothetical protein
MEANTWWTEDVRDRSTKRDDACRIRSALTLSKVPGSISKGFAVVAITALFAKK